MRGRRRTKGASNLPPCVPRRNFDCIPGKTSLGELPRLVAAAEHGGHQTKYVGLHAALGGVLRLGGARFFDLLAHEADIVLSRLTLLRGHVRLLRKTPIGPPWTGNAQSLVNFPSRMNTDTSAARA